jgi:chromosome segregation ATPase
LELLRRREDELEKATNELKVARSLLDKTNQPYSYLVSNIEDKEKEVLMLRAENKKLDQSYQDIKEEYRELRRQLEEAEKDVERLLVKRESIQHIQSILVDLTRGPTSATQINSAVQEIRDILGTTSFKKTGPLTNSVGLAASGQLGADRPTSEPPSWYKKLVDKKK